MVNLRAGHGKIDSTEGAFSRMVGRGPPRHHDGPAPDRGAGRSLARELDRIIADDSYFLSPRITALREMRTRLKPYPEQPAAAPPRQHCAPPTGGPLPKAPMMTPYRGPPLTLGDAVAAGPI